MFCTNCGEKLLEQEQKFCQNCGTITKTTYMTSYSGSQQTIMNTRSKTQILQKNDILPQNPLATGGIGPHSKRSLIFGIISLGFNGVGGIMSIFTTAPLIYSDKYFDVFGVLIELIIRSLLFIVALLFGILARSNGNKAEIFESYNGMQKAGKIMGLIGMILCVYIGPMILIDVFSYNYNLL